MLDEALRPVLPAVLALLDLPVEDAAWQALDPPQRRRRTLDGLKALLVRESARQPLALVFEDLHWIDGETQALLDGLVESLPTCRILLLVNYRPEYRHGWGSRAHYTQLRIDPLAAAGAEQLLVRPARRCPGARRPQAAPARGERGQSPVPRGERAQPRRCRRAGRRPRRLPPRPRARRARGPGERRRDHRGAHRPARRGREDRAAARRGRRRGRAARPARGGVRARRRTSCTARSPSCAPASSCTRRGCSRTSPTPSGTASPGGSPTTACCMRAAARCTRRVAAALEALHADHLDEAVEALAHHYEQGGVWAKAADYVLRAADKAKQRYTYPLAAESRPQGLRSRGARSGAGAGARRRARARGRPAQPDRRPRGRQPELRGRERADRRRGAAPARRAQAAPTRRRAPRRRPDRLLPARRRRRDAAVRQPRRLRPRGVPADRRAAVPGVPHRHHRPARHRRLGPLAAPLRPRPARRRTCAP